MAAEKRYQAAMELREQRVALQPDSVEALRDLSISHNRLGDLAQGRGDGLAAEKHYCQGLTIIETTIGRLGLFGDLAAVGRYLADRLVALGTNDGEHTLAPNSIAALVDFLRLVQSLGQDLSEDEVAFLNRHAPTEA